MLVTVYRKGGEGASIAMRAYERWVKRGRPQGTDKQDWFEAEADLKREMMAGGGRR